MDSLSFHLKTRCFGKRVNYLVGPHSKREILVQQQDAAASGLNIPNHFLSEDVTFMHKPSYVHEFLITAIAAAVST